MKAILTKFISQTNHKPARIKAYDSVGNSILVSWDEATNNDRRHEEAYLYAAKQLAIKMGWSTNLLGGGTKEGYAFVFADTRIR